MRLLDSKTNDFGPTSVGPFLCSKKNFKKKIKKKVANKKIDLSLWGHKAQDDQHFLTFTYLSMRFRFSFIVTDAAAFTAMITPYDFDNAEIMRVQDQGTGVFEVYVFAFEKDLAQLEKLAAKFA